MSRLGTTLDTVSRVVNALQNVHDTIVDVIDDHSRRSSAESESESVHCAHFIADIEELTQISHDLAQADEIVRLSAEIKILAVENCSFDHVQSLHGHKDTIMSHILGHLALSSSSTFSSTSKLKVDLEMCEFLATFKKKV